MSTILKNNRNLLGPEFDPWKFDRPERIGIILGIFKDMNVLEILEINIDEMIDFVLLVEDSYQNVPYHSFCHAVDVFVKTYYMLNDLEMSNYLTKYDIISLMISALCHDTGHPGLNNLYQVNARTNLSKKYPKSTLESYSVDLTLYFLEETSLLRNLVGVSDPIYIDFTIGEKDIKQALLAEITEAILLTDMARHFEVVDMCTALIKSLSEKAKQIKNRYEPLNYNQKNSKNFPNGCSFDTNNLYSRRPVSETIPVSKSPLSLNSDCLNTEIQEALNSIKKTSIKSNESNVQDKSTEKSKVSINRPQSMMKNEVLLNSKQRRCLVNVLLHAVDIFNPVLPWDMSKKWSELMMDESLAQGDLEKKYGLQVTPSMDRETYNQYLVSIEFSSIIIMPFFRELTNLIPVREQLLDNIGRNLEMWKSLYSEQYNQILPQEKTPEMAGKEKLKENIQIINPFQKNLEEASNIPKKDVSVYLEPITPITPISSPLSPVSAKQFPGVFHDEARRLSVAAGTIEILPIHYSNFRRHSDDFLEGIDHQTIGMFFSEKLKKIQNRRKKTTESREQAGFETDILKSTYDDDSKTPGNESEKNEEKSNEDQIKSLLKPEIQPNMISFSNKLNGHSSQSENRSHKIFLENIGKYMNRCSLDTKDVVNNPIRSRMSYSRNHQSKLGLDRYLGLRRTKSETWEHKSSFYEDEETIKDNTISTSDTFGNHSQNRKKNYESHSADKSTNMELIDSKNDDFSPGLLTPKRATIT
ncbi:hypothetical protein BB559_004852 [Furculomyces boomerangus]|uniref:PDEase domain-containing protein n=1 Tax=Furculomyces boomerangus TaxID=61424 RepID=A0A2T9YCA4_9FUNG|nr:hypothetical protein BB559_004852 [Furculomyces boomerangus]